MEDVAGYRVLRTAGRGDRAQLLVGFDDGRTVVLKIAPAADRLAFVEVAALDRAAGEHVVEVLDVSADGDETVLVLERLAKGTLAELLERRVALDAGEAVTVLAPIASTLERLHSAGVAHARLSLAAICFRDDGAPALIGFGNAELFAPGAPEVVRETVPGVLADREALHDIARIVLDRVAGARGDAARRLAASLESGAPSDLAERLFGLAPASPVRFDDLDEAPLVQRMGTTRDPEPAELAGPGRLPPWITALIPDGMRERLEEPVARAIAIWSSWEMRRRRVVLAVVAGSITVLGALALVPPAPAASTVAGPTPTGSPTASADSGSGLPEDPVEAAIVLLQLREGCLRDLSMLCLDDVVQPDSSAQAADHALIRDVQAGGEYPASAVTEGAPLLVERLGDAALLDLPAGSDPASVLLMRTADGWRIRQYLTDESLDSPTGLPGS